MKREKGKQNQTVLFFYLIKKGNNSACRVSVSHSLKCWTVFTKVRVNVVLSLRDAAHTGGIFAEFPLDVLAH